MNKQTSTSEENRYQFRLISGISLGIFLFLLFFLPFDHRELEYNENLLFITGLASISFVIMAIFRIVLPVWLNRIMKLETVKISNEVVMILLVWVFNSLSYVFYLRFVGMLHITLFIGVKIVLFAGFPSVILKLADVNKNLRIQLEHIVGRNIKLGRNASDDEAETVKLLEFMSESKTDKIEIHPDDLMLVRAADNYVSIVYKSGTGIKQKMLRKTITNAQVKLRKYPEFIRCHRSCIINSHYILTLSNSYMGYRLKLLDYDDEIPVSRQYILAIKEYMDTD